ncbi:MAG: hypothetical protein C0469_18010 [Cyanobacteria bacterium DS2.3.42]|nr:hypothetical protein [Cyanobacteria bacterium DS2.3.42]
MFRPIETGDNAIASPINNNNALSQESALLLAEYRPPVLPVQEDDFLEFTNLYEDTPVVAVSREQSVGVPVIGVTDTNVAVKPLAELSEKRSAFEFDPDAPRTVSVEETDSPASPRNWTMAIDLTASGDVRYNGENIPTGATSKLAQILDMAEKTRDQPITLYVQAALPLPTTVGEDGRVHSNRKDQEVATYRLENGQVTLVDQGPSRGLEQDLVELLKRASQRAGEGNLGLIIQSHGFAAKGLGGDTGEVSLSELEQAITNGLEGSSKTSLDLINFDSCLMGNLNVVQSMQGEAEHIVASAEIESAVEDADGQNMRTTLSALFDNPDLTPEEYAAVSVRLASEGHNDESGNTDLDSTGTYTLAHIAVEQYPQMEVAMDELGAELTQLIADPAQRQTITEIMDGIRPFSEGGAMLSGSFTFANRDLGLFLTALDEKVRDGELSDPDGSLIRGLEQTRQAISELIPQYHGENFDQYDQMSGLSLFLPDGEHLDVTSLMQEASPLGDMVSSLSNNNAIFDNRDRLVKSLTFNLETMSSYGDTSALAAGIGRIGVAEDEAQMKDAIAYLKALLEKEQSGVLGNAWMAEERPEFNNTRDEIFAEQLEQLSPKWREFLTSLRLQ